MPSCQTQDVQPSAIRQSRIRKDHSRRVRLFKQHHQLCGVSCPVSISALTPQGQFEPVERFVTGGYQEWDDPLQRCLASSEITNETLL
jgi:hypothetical protein